MKKRVIGYQIADNLGQVLHGERELEEFSTFEVLTPAAATEFMSAHPDRGYMLLPIYNDITNAIEVISWWPRPQRWPA